MKAHPLDATSMSRLQMRCHAVRFPSFLVAVLFLGCKPTTASFPLAEVMPSCQAMAYGGQTVIMVAFAGKGQTVELAERHRLAVRVDGGEEVSLLPFISEVSTEGGNVLEQKVAYEIRIQAESGLELGFGTKSQPTQWAPISSESIDPALDVSGEPRLTWGELPVTLRVRASCALDGRRFIVREFSSGPASVPVRELVPPSLQEMQNGTDDPRPCGALRLELSWQRRFSLEKLGLDPLGSCVVKQYRKLETAEAPNVHDSQPNHDEIMKTK